MDDLLESPPLRHPQIVDQMSFVDALLESPLLQHPQIVDWLDGSIAKKGRRCIDPTGWYIMIPNPTASELIELR